MATVDASSITAERFLVRGVVQGVGFRPFVYRSARRLGLVGWIRNDDDGVLIHLEGPVQRIARFRGLLAQNTPKSAAVGEIESRAAEPSGAATFRILPSESASSTHGVRVPPDLAICPTCCREVLDPSNLRAAYPFTTCTACGPRYSLIQHLPYDRAATGMAGFPLCRDCRGEYESPADRRFHAESIACSKCGPNIALWDFSGREIAAGKIAVGAAADRVRSGEVLALKGLGGFQLLVRADNPEAVQRLRDRKHRPTKPFAVMVPNLRTAARLARLGSQSRRLLRSPENPIVLVEQRPGIEHLLAAEVAPNLRWIGLFLPTTPLHHLLLGELDFVIVATSGNRGDEPIETDECEVMTRLAGLADCFLVHNRPVVRRVDDSVVRPTAAGSVIIRLARGFAPLPLPGLERWLRQLDRPVPPGVLAAGGQQKAAVALWTGTQAALGPHIGDLDGADTRTVFQQTVHDLAELYGCPISVVAHDLHPDYASTHWAHSLGVPTRAVQHHHAHTVAVMAEHDLLDEEVLAFTWDGTGFGPDGSIWGGEVLRARIDNYERVASLRPFALPGGEAAIREPARVALTLAADAFEVETVLADTDLLARLGIMAANARTLLKLADRGVNAPRTTSLGRLFDGIAALTLRANRVSYEGEACAWLESVAEDAGKNHRPYDLPNGDWRPLIRSVLGDVRSGVAAGTIADRFHRAIAAWAMEVAAKHPSLPIVLGGGCFQNRRLLEQTRSLLLTAGRAVYIAKRVPSNDGGLAVGQLAVALATMVR